MQKKTFKQFSRIVRDHHIGWLRAAVVELESSGTVSPETAERLHLLRTANAEHRERGVSA